MVSLRSQRNDPTSFFRVSLNLKGGEVKKYPDWADFDIDKIAYGFHKYGIGPYHVEAELYWLDEERSRPEEKEAYSKHVKEYESTKPMNNEQENVILVCLDCNAIGDSEPIYHVKGCSKKTVEYVPKSSLATLETRLQMAIETFGKISSFCAVDKYKAPENVIHMCQEAIEQLKAKG